MSWNYGDDAGWYVPGVWSSFSGPLEEEVTAMAQALSPRQAAQKAADSIRKAKPNLWNGGRWWFFSELDVVVLDPPRHAFLFALHQPSLKFFRSKTSNSPRLTSSSLRTIINPERSWIIEAMQKIVAHGPDFLAFERGDQSVMDRPALARARNTPTQPSPPEPVPVAPAPKVRPPSPERIPMALLDIQSSTKRVVIEQISRTVDIDRKQLIAILRSAGASTLQKDAKIRLIAAGGSSDLELDDAGVIRIEWAESKETETSE